MFNRIAAGLLNDSFTPQRNSDRNERPKPREMKPKTLKPLEIKGSQPKSLKIENVNTSKKDMVGKIDVKSKISKEEINEKLARLENLLFPNGLNNERPKILRNTEKSNLSDNKNVKNIDEFKAGNENKFKRKKSGSTIPSKNKVENKIQQRSNLYKEKIKKIILDRGWTLLDDNINATKKSKMTCEKDHVFNKNGRQIEGGSECKKCKEEIKFEKDKKLVELLGGELLGRERKEGITRLKVKCKEGHKFNLRPDKLRKGTWCQTCKKEIPKKYKENRKIFLEKIKRLKVENPPINYYQELKRKVEDLGYTLLTPEDKYVNMHTKVQVRCNKGHLWEPSPLHIKRGSKCGECNVSRKKSYDEIKNMIESEGLILLTPEDEYINMRTKVKISCGEHNFEITPNNIKIGHRCAECEGLKPHTYDDVKEIIEASGLTLLSPKEDYTNFYDSKLKVRCEFNHVTEMAASSVKYGHGCKDCLKKNESQCRKEMEFIFGAEFPTVRPDWLLNDEGNRLELDGFNEDLKIAFEYNGQQHYEHIDFFHPSEEDFKRLQHHDEIKRNACEDNGITLIEIPYTTPSERLQDYIIEKARENGLNFV